MRPSIRAGLYTFAVAALLFACRSGDTVESQADSSVLTFTINAHDISAPLRELAKDPVPMRIVDEEETEPARPIPHTWGRGVDAARTGDRVAQRVMGTAPALAPGVSFEGLGAGIAGSTSGVQPPDTDGDIGPNHYVQVVNLAIAVFSRTGQVLMGPVNTSTIWKNFNGACANTNDGDATVRYDHLADRWVISQFSLGANFAGPFFQCVAVSTTADPTGTYARFQFPMPALNDYPKMGLWPDGYYFTFNMFNLQTNAFLGGKICAMDRVKMLAGDATATMQCFDAGKNNTTGDLIGGVLAADLDGKTLPPPGAPNYLVALDNETTMQYYTLHVDYATPANSKLTGPTPITVTTFAPLCNGGSCVKQPAGGSQLGSLADRLMNRFVYRRFGDHESLLISHSVTAGTGGGIRWYELRTPNTPTIFQSGTFAPDNSFRWIPSIAMDAAGEIATVYTVSSTAINPSIRFTARVPSDAPGTMSLAESTIVAGSAVQATGNRWGDYAALNIDPVDDCTFWATHEYRAGSTTGSNWRTRVGSFTLPGCSAFSVTADAQTIKQGAMGSFPVTTKTIAGAQQMVTLAATGLPTGVTATFNPAMVKSGDPSMITLTADAAATVGMTHYAITATGTGTSTMADVALTVEMAQQGGGDAGDGSNGSGDDGGGGGKSGGCCRVSEGESPLAPLLLGLGVVIVIGRRRRR